MLTTRIVVSVFSIVMMILGAGIVSGQNYPNKPVRIFTGPPSGGNDLTARLISQELSSSLGQPVITENRVLLVSIDTVAKAPPDGYTLLQAANTLWNLPFMSNKVSWDTLRDFAPISGITIVPNVLVVHPSLPVKSVKELIALAKARPGELNYGNSGLGTEPHLGAELFKYMAGVNIVRVDYKGNAGAVAAIMGGEVQLGFNSAPSVAAHVKSGRLRALAVTSAQPSVLAPGLPTVAAASGLPGYESVVLVGIYTAAKTPAAIINRLNQEIVRTLHKEDVKEKLLSVGVEAVGSSPEQLLATMKSSMTTVGKLIKDTGISAD